MISKYSILVCLLIALTRAGPIGEPAHGLDDLPSHADQPFKLSLFCGKPLGFSQAVQRAFDRAGRRISQEFKIKKEIKVAMVLLPTCDRKRQLNCIFDDTTNAGNPLAWVPVRHRDDNATYMYPTPLLKQLDYEGADQILWPEYDMEIRVSSDVQWWFPDYPNRRSITFEQHDMETMFLKQMLHGLGFGMSNVYYIKPEHRNLVLPSPRFTAAPDLQWALDRPIWKTNAISGWAHPTIWDKFTYLNGTSSTEWRDRMEACLVQSPDSSLWVQNNKYDKASILDDACTTKTASNLHKLLTTGGASVFDCAAWPAAKPEQSKISLNKNRHKFLNGRTGLLFWPRDLVNFLMWPDWDYGTALEERIEFFGAPPSGIGPEIKDMMLALGYCSNGGDCAPRTHLAIVDPSVRNKDFPDQTASTDIWEVIQSLGNASSHNF